MSTQSQNDGYAPPYPTNSRGYAKVNDLKPHPINREIYADRDNETLVDRIERHGFKDSQRLLVCANGTILSGHRRLDAAKEVGLERVPVEVVDIDPDSDEALLELLTANEYRDKNPAEIVNEGEAWEELEREKAKEREQSGGKENFPDGDTGQTRDKVGEKVGVSGRTYEKGKTVKEKAKEGDETAQREWEKMQSGDQSIHGAYSEIKKAERESESEPETETPPLPDDTYRCVVIDPPWDMEKIGRDERPDQGRYLDYPTMSLEEIRGLPVPDLLADDGAHVYLWTTNKRVPDALSLFDEWGVRYECLLTWVKPTGVAPFSWQYNTEHVLFGRAGDGLKLEQQGRQLSFEAPITEHSAKPDVFYERVTDASPDPRLEMFARTERDGFEVWGDEVDDDI